MVLNAQLQSAISLADYAKATSDSGASDLAAALQSAAARALPFFSNGYWSYYQLPSDPSPVNYQDYVVQLLQTMARRDDRFATAAGQFERFGTTPPLFRLADAGVGKVTFWVSKPSSVHISAGGRVRGLSVWSGWHTVSLGLPQRAGVFPVTIRATDWKGNVRGRPRAPDRPRLGAPEEAQEGEAEGQRGRLEHAAAARRGQPASSSRHRPPLPPPWATAR